MKRSQSPHTRTSLPKTKPDPEAYVCPSAWDTDTRHWANKVVIRAEERSALSPHPSALLPGLRKAGSEKTHPLVDIRGRGDFSRFDPSPGEAPL